MYPLKFTKILKEKVWGGRQLETLLSVPLETGKTYGESWEVSAHPNGPSVVSLGPWQGKSLPELVAEHGEKLLGKEVWERSNQSFPLLIKYLDVHDKLSIQVHPDDAYALAHEGERGKSECWYVLQASSDASLILGIAPGMDREQFRQRALAGQWEGLFRVVPVSTGDFVQITPGTVHASLTGSLLICEIQQSSDTTYRIYDFDRKVDGALRPLHLEKALQVIAFGKEPRLSHAGDRPKRSEQGAVRESLVKDPLYTVDLVTVSSDWSSETLDQFQIFSAVEGKGQLQSAGQAYEVCRGETWMLPAGVSGTWSGPLTLVRSTIDSNRG